MKFNLEEKKKRKWKNGLSITPFITQKKDAGDVEKGIENFNTLMNTGSPIGPAASGGMGESLGEKEMTEKFKDSYEYNDLDNLIGMIKVNAPESREEEKPEAKECMINEINIPDNMRFKDWDIDAIGDDVIQLYWTTQEPFTSEDGEKFIAEIKRFFEALIKRENFKKPFTVALEVMCRSLDEDDGHLVYDLEFNKEEINEGMDEGKKYLLIYNYGGNEEGTETSSYDSLEEAKQALKHKYKAIRRLYRESNSAGIDEDETYITDNLMYAHVQEREDPSYTNIQWDELIIESPTAESKLNSNNNEEELKENKMDILNESNKKYDYDDAIDYIESQGIGCDPAGDIEGDEVCGLLDDWYDGQNRYGEYYYYKSTLENIIKEAKNYLEDSYQDYQDMIKDGEKLDDRDLAELKRISKILGKKDIRESKVEFKHLHEVMKEEKINPDEYDFKKASIYDKLVPEGTVLYKIFNFDDNHKFLTCDTDAVKAYLNDNIGKTISLYQNNFELKSEKFDYILGHNVAFKKTGESIITEGYYNFSDIGKRFEKIKLNDINVKTIINSLEESVSKDIDNLAHFAVKAYIDVKKVADNGIYCYTTAPFRNLLKYSTESNGKNILITSRWSLDRLDKEAIKAELKQINVDVKISNMQKLQEDLNNVTEVEDKAKEVMDPTFASAVREIRSHDKGRAELKKVRKAPKEGEESLPKDLKMNLDESLFTEWVKDVEVLNKIKSPVSDDVELSADMKLRDAYTAYEPEEFQLDRLRNDITLKEVWEKMKAGEDIYELASVDGKGFDSAVREGIFVMLEMVLGIDYDTIYNTWLNN